VLTGRKAARRGLADIGLSSGCLLCTFILAVFVCAGLGASTAIAAAPTISEFPTTSGTNPTGITAGSDGALWYMEPLSNAIGRITTSGSVTDFPIPSANSFNNTSEGWITSGPDGALWFTEPNNDNIGRITTAGVVSEFPITTTDSVPTGIAAGADGALWFGESNVDQIGRITTSGMVSEFPTPGVSPWGVTLGPDNAIWFVQSLGNTVGRITTSGSVTEFTLPPGVGTDGFITSGPDGALWFTQDNGNIGRITTAGVVTEFPLPASGETPWGITAGSDGALWFTEASSGGSGTIGRITTDGTVSEFTLPEVSLPWDITAGPSGNLWFSDQQEAIGRIVPAGGPPAQSAAKVSPTFLDFGAVPVGQQSAPQTVALTNTGSSPLVMGTVGIAGAQAADFRLSTNTCTGNIAAGGSCTASVTFVPGSSTNGLFAAELQFADNASGSPQSVNLSGVIPSSSVTGTVRNGTQPNTPPLSGVSVEICQTANRGHCHSGLTDSLGHYSFGGRTPGSYNVEVLPSLVDLFGGSAVVDVIAGETAIRDFTLQPPTPAPAGVSVDGSAGTAPGGIPVLNWNQPFTVNATLELPTRDEPGLHGYFIDGVVTPTAGGLTAGQAILFAARYGRDGKLQSVSQELSGQLIPTDANTNSTLRDARGSAVARLAKSCSGQPFSLMPGPNGGVHVNLGPVHFTLVPLAVNAAPLIKTGNNALDAGLSMAANLALNAAINSIPIDGVPGGVGGYNTMVGALNAVSQFNAGNIVPGGAEAVPIVIAMNFLLNSQVHGASNFTANMATGLVGTVGASSTFLPSVNCGPKPPFPPLPFNIWIDPSGRVLAQNGQPLAHARVVLQRSPNPHASPKPVPNGSSVMSPANRRNPDFTDELGSFGWDVIPGLYRIIASDHGCRALHSTSSSSATPLLTVPPPRVNLLLHLRCAHLPRRAPTRTQLHTSDVKNFYALRAVVQARQKRSLGDVTFVDGERALATVAIDSRTEAATLTVYLKPGTRHAIRAVYSGTAQLAPSRSQTFAVR